jgi:hypothetical protein
LALSNSIRSEEDEFSIHSIGRSVAGNTSRCLSVWRTRIILTLALVRLVSARRELRRLLPRTGQLRREDCCILLVQYVRRTNADVVISGNNL